MARYRLTHTARSDISDILAWSHQQFGEQVRLRYQRLIATAVRDVAADPTRPGSHERPELGNGVRSWHLAAGRARAGTRGIRGPRHFLIYRVDGELVVIGRVLHDAMELHRHIDPGRTWQ